MNEQELELGVCDVLRAVLRCEDPKAVRRETCEAWDSLRHVEIVFALEERFEFTVGESELASLSSYQDIVRIVELRN